MLDGYDWEEVFKYGASPRGAVPPDDESFQDIQPGFGLGDVEEVLHAVEGENDGPEWVALVRLKDGRFAAVTAGCDYTGWG